MTTINTYLKNNGWVISAIRWLLLPILMAASLFWLDGRYVTKDDWSEYKIVAVESSNEQRQGLAKLTDAITKLAEEQRNVAELQRSNAAQLAIYTTLQVDQNNKAERRIEKIETVINSLGNTVSRHEALLSGRK